MPTAPGLDITVVVTGCADAHRRLLALIDGLDDPGARAPSRLPDWSVGHVLTHLARNADSHVHALDGARRGVPVHRYPGGPAQRAGDIAAGAGRPAAELVADVRASIQRLEAAWASVAETDWAGAFLDHDGTEAAVVWLPFLRWREVECHSVDLDRGAEPEAWPDAYVAEELRQAEAELGPFPPAAQALAPWERAAWVMGRRAPARLEPVPQVVLTGAAGGTGPLAAALAALVATDADAATAARARQLTLAKPPGALGQLERLGEQLAALARRCPPPVPAPVAVAVFAADHGTVAQGVTPWPREVTAQMVATFLDGAATVNALARQVGAAVTVVDVGVATPLAPVAGLRAARVRAGTGDIAVEPAMTSVEAAAALDVGAAVAADLVAAGARALVAGDMGIGNTTASAALVAALTGRPAVAVTGRGTGIDDAMLERKTAVVARAVARAGSNHDPLTLVAELGGLELAALAGFVVGGAAARVPVVLDGVVTLAAALVAHGLDARILGYCIAGHRSPEPGASAALEHLGLVPLLDLGLRLGEGTGALLAVPLVQAAARVLGEVATLDAAGVGAPQGGR